MTDIEKGIKLRSGKVLLLPIEPILGWDHVLEGLAKYVSSQEVEESIEEEVSSKIDVPNGFGEVAGDYLEQLNHSYQDRQITHEQLLRLIVEFAKYLSWFPDDVPQKNIKKFCREAYAHTLWKTFIDEEISRKQFVSLMGRRPKFFPKE